MISGPNQVEVGSKSGPHQVRAEGFSWVGAGGVGPGGRVPLAPRKVSTANYCPQNFYVMANPMKYTQKSGCPSVIS